MILGNKRGARCIGALLEGDEGRGTVVVVGVFDGGVVVKHCVMALLNVATVVGGAARCRRSSRWLLTGTAGALIYFLGRILQQGRGDSCRRDDPSHSTYQSLAALERIGAQPLIRC